MNYGGFMNLKEQRQLHSELDCQKDTKAGRFLSSRSARDTASSGPGMVDLVISGWGPSKVVYRLYFNRDRRSLNSFAMLKENVCLLSPKD